MVCEGMLGWRGEDDERVRCHCHRMWRDGLGRCCRHMWGDEVRRRRPASMWREWWVRPRGRDEGEVLSSSRVEGRARWVRTMQHCRSVVSSLSPPRSGGGRVGEDEGEGGG